MTLFLISKQSISPVNDFALTTHKEQRQDKYFNQAIFDLRNGIVGRMILDFQI